MDEAARTERRLQGLPGISPRHGVAYRHECRRTIHRTPTDRCRAVALACQARAATRAGERFHARAVAPTRPAGPQGATTPPPPPPDTPPTPHPRPRTQ